MLSGNFFGIDVGMPSVPQLYFDFISSTVFPISVGVLGFIEIDWDVDGFKKSL